MPRRSPRLRRQGYYSTRAQHARLRNLLRPLIAPLTRSRGLLLIQQWRHRQQVPALFAADDSSSDSSVPVFGAGLFHDSNASSSSNDDDDSSVFTLFGDIEAASQPPPPIVVNLDDFDAFPHAGAA